MQQTLEVLGLESGSLKQIASFLHEIARFVARLGGRIVRSLARAEYNPEVSKARARETSWTDEALPMSTPFEDIEKEARRLSADERAKLAEVLLESLQESPLADVNAAWDAEIAQRVAAFERGDLPTHFAEDVFAEARRLIK